MTVVELIEAARNRRPTDDQIDEFVRRNKEREAEYAKKARDREVTTEMLNRVYSI